MFAKFEYIAPATVEELLGILAQEKSGTVIYGGGTDVIVDLRSEKLQAERLIDIKTIPELRRITEKKTASAWAAPRRSRRSMMTRW